MVWQSWPADVLERGIHGMTEIQRGIDQRSVKIEHKQAGRNRQHGC
jgi:hypothetical protein